MGFLVVDRLAQDLGAPVNNRRCQALTATGQIGGEKVVLAKPETFMNLSGLSVAELIERTTDSSFDVTRDLIVVYDELDLLLGRLQVRERGGAAGHNGIKSILGALGTETWVRVRVGIAPEHKPSNAAKYVLAPFRKADLPVIDEAIERAAEAVRSIITDGVATAMNRFNRRPDEKIEGATPTA
jgi:PTH1 family peptidyl-tRNA hydrolase